MAKAAVKAYKENPDADPRWDASPRSYGSAWRRGCADAISLRMVARVEAVKKTRDALEGKTMEASAKSNALVRIDVANEYVARVNAAVDDFKVGLKLSAGAGFTGGQGSNGGYSAGRTAGGNMNLGGGNKALK